MNSPQTLHDHLSTVNLQLSVEAVSDPKRQFKMIDARAKVSTAAECYREHPSKPGNASRFSLTLPGAAVETL